MLKHAKEGMPNREKVKTFKIMNVGKYSGKWAISIHEVFIDLGIFV
jgi:hypothetical protein